MKKNDLTLEELFIAAKKSKDFTRIERSIDGTKIYLSYFTTLVDHEIIQKSLLPYLNSPFLKNIDDLSDKLPIEDISFTEDVKEISLKLYKGHVILQNEQSPNVCILLNIHNATLGLRQSNDAENEFSVIGPKMGFVEDLDTNLNLLRKKVNSHKLVIEEMIIGSMSKTRVAIVYLDGITNEQNINTVKQRLQNFNFDVIFDTSILDQLIRDNKNTPFPLLMSTERIDRIIYTLINGQVAIFSDGSPNAISGPATLLDFFISPEDYYLNWVLGTFFRVIRILGVLFSVFSSSIYVAVLTFHYEVIPKDLLGPLIESRANVPFPPFLEAFFLEITIELLREAGARLPTKVGQTLGIVGGIVIGQAAVAAALTSNVLLIIVSLSALASFTTPIIVMGNTIRILRFFFITAAAFLGGFGIIIGVMFLLGHLFRLKSLGSPYMVPLYPFRRNSLADSFIRSPLSVQNKRAPFLRPKQLIRFYVKESRTHKGDLNDEE
jgi:hypothetical protein